MSTRRATSLVEALLAISLAAGLTLACATLYAFVSSRLMKDGTQAAVLNQANALAEDLTTAISQSRLCTTVTSGSVTALRCHLPSTGADFNIDGLIDRPTPLISDPDGTERYQTGNYVWFYMANSSGTWGSAGTYLWRAKPTTTSSPAIADLDSNWSLYYSGSSRWNLIDSVTFSIDPGRQTTTFTIRASSLNRAERSASGLPTGGDNYQVAITRTVRWHYARNLVINPSFEYPSGGAGSGNFSIIDDEILDGWQTVGDYVDIHYGGHAWTPHGGNQILDCASNQKSGARQMIITGVGKTYLLSFYYAPRPEATSNAVEIWWNDAKIDTVNISTPGWTLKTYTVTATKNLTNLEFRDGGVNDSYTGLIDNVSVLEY
jgi:hypothetical protein